MDGLTGRGTDAIYIIVRKGLGEEDARESILVGAEIEENLSIRYLAASLRQAGHEARILRFDSMADLRPIEEMVLAEKPEMVGLSMVNQLRATEFYTLAERLRACGYRGHIVTGGHFPTFAYRELLLDCPAIDSVVLHEGEHTIAELASSLGQTPGGSELGSVKGLAFRKRGGAVVRNVPRPLERDLDRLPFPVRDGRPRAHLGVPAATVVGSRG